jgi:hypothetical protein
MGRVTNTEYGYVRGEPAMILSPKGPAKKAFVICLSAAHKYDESEYLVAGAMKAVRVLGLTEDKQTAYRVSMDIEDGLDDLVKMPPEKPKEAKVIGDGSAKFGEQEFNFDIKDDF